MISHLESGKIINILVRGIWCMLISILASLRYSNLVLQNYYNKYNVVTATQPFIITYNNNYSYHVIRDWCVSQIG